LRYDEGLATVKGIRLPIISAGHVFHQYTILVTEGKRDQLQSYLEGHGIGSAIYYPIPQDRLPVYAGLYPTYKNSSQVAEAVLSLPISAYMTDENVDRVINIIRDK